MVLKSARAYDVLDGRDMSKELVVKLTRYLTWLSLALVVREEIIGTQFNQHQPPRQRGESWR